MSDNEVNEQPISASEALPAGFSVQSLLIEGRLDDTIDVYAIAKMLPGLHEIIGRVESEELKRHYSHSNEPNTVDDVKIIDPFDRVRDRSFEAKSLDILWDQRTLETPQPVAVIFHYKLKSDHEMLDVYGRKPTYVHGTGATEETSDNTSIKLVPLTLDQVTYHLVEDDPGVEEVLEQFLLQRYTGIPDLYTGNPNAADQFSRAMRTRRVVRKLMANIDAKLSDEEMEMLVHVDTRPLLNQSVIPTDDPEEFIIPRSVLAMRVAKEDTKKADIEHANEVYAQGLMDSFSGSAEATRALLEQVGAVSPLDLSSEGVLEILRLKLADKIEVWRANGGLGWGRRYNARLIVRPNIMLKPEQVKKLLQEFNAGLIVDKVVSGEDVLDGAQESHEQLFSGDPNEAINQLDRYTEEELSGGIDSEEPVDFVLLPLNPIDQLYGENLEDFTKEFVRITNEAPYLRRANFIDLLCSLKQHGYLYQHSFTDLKAFEHPNGGMEPWEAEEFERLKSQPQLDDWNQDYFDTLCNRSGTVILEVGQDSDGIAIDFKDVNEQVSACMVVK